MGGAAEYRLASRGSSPGWLALRTAGAKCHHPLQGAGEQRHRVPAAQGAWCSLRSLRRESFIGIGILGQDDPLIPQSPFLPG
jgi:hypothetical protein